MILLSGAVLIVLIIIAYQDFKYRAVYWICFPVLAVLLGIHKTIDNGFQSLLTESLFTVGFLLIQFLVLWLYFTIKYRKSINLTNGYLGWGDILFLLAVCFYLSPLNYVVFYVGSLMASIIYALANRLISKKDTLTIPLAGIQALLFALLLIIAHMMHLNFDQDSYTLYKLLPL